MVGERCKLHLDIEPSLFDVRCVFGLPWSIAEETRVNHVAFDEAETGIAHIAQAIFDFSVSI